MSISTESSRVEPLLEVGRICKPHGLRGDVIVDLTTDRTERLDVGTQLETNRGIVTVRHSQRHQNRFIVAFAEIASREEAESWRNVTLLASPIDDPATLWVHELIGSTVETLDGTRCGTVVSVLDNPASDLLVLDDDRLIPVVFIVDGPVENEGVRLIRIDPPEGLLEL